MKELEFLKNFNRSARRVSVPPVSENFEKTKFLKISAISANSQNRNFTMKELEFLKNFNRSERRVSFPMFSENFEKNKIFENFCNFCKFPKSKFHHERVGIFEKFQQI